MNADWSSEKAAPDGEVDLSISNWDGWDVDMITSYSSYNPYYVAGNHSMI